MNRAEDLSTLAAELCNLGMFVQHAPLVRKAIQLALEGAGAMSARHLASLAQACGVLGNVPKAHMLVSTGSLLVMSKHSSLALISPPPQPSGEVIQKDIGLTIKQKVGSILCRLFN